MREMSQNKTELRKKMSQQVVLDKESGRAGTLVEESAEGKSKVIWNGESEASTVSTENVEKVSIANG
jgi:hypothetical protein